VTTTETIKKRLKSGSSIDKAIEWYPPAQVPVPLSTLPAPLLPSPVAAAPAPKPLKVMICIPSGRTWEARTATSVAGLAAYSALQGLSIGIINSKAR